MKLPDKLTAFKPYPAMTGPVSVRADGNESCFALPRELQNAIADAVRSAELHRYPDPYAAEVCALAEAFWHAPKGSAVAGNGSDELISVALAALVPRGGKLLVCDPDFSMYRFYSSLYELETVGLQRRSGIPDIGEVSEKAKTAGAVILSNPCNPTGQGIPKEEALRIVEAAPCPVLLDEAYMDFWEGGKQTLLPFIEDFENLIVLKTCSKNLALAGARLGFAFAGERLRSVLRSVKSPYNVSCLSQAAGAALLRRPEWIRENTRNIVTQKDKLFKMLQTLPGLKVTDTVANFVLVCLPDAEKAHKNLQDQGINVRYINGLLRVTAGTDKENERLIEVLS
jgi:histidinol-phosphate aminotransferase